MIHSVEEAAEPGRPVSSILGDGEGGSHGGGDGAAMILMVDLEKERKRHGERKGMALGFAWGGEGGLIPSMGPQDQRRVCIGGGDVRATSTTPLVNRGRR